VEKQNAFADSEAAFRDPDERLRAVAASLGLCSWLDHNVGQILAALDEAGLADTTTVAYTSDHGDNLGARGLWGNPTCIRNRSACR
jgi:choline-sulfatase